ncbi:hypothetical protein D3C71_1927860 [compost metagenome]
MNSSSLRRHAIDKVGEIALRLASGNLAECGIAALKSTKYLLAKWYPSCRPRLALLCLWYSADFPI